METITIEKDIKVFYVNAKSFPDGIMKAHENLHSIVPFSNDRKYFGLSRPENNSGIVYRAATEEIQEGEAENYKCETLIIKKGNYISIVISNYREDFQSIGTAFHNLLSNQDIDPLGYCVEWYLNENDVNCMVRLNN